VPPDRSRLAEILRTARRIAVVGLSRKPERPSHGVAAYLQRAGYTIIPDHPEAGVTLGERV
jgi:predicted CoA-binding protein